MVQIIRFKIEHSSIFSTLDVGILIAEVIIMRFYCLKEKHLTHAKENLFYPCVAIGLYTVFAEQFRAGLYTDGAAGRCNRALR